MSSWLHRHAFSLAYVSVIAAAFLLLRGSQVAACERGNALRAQVNVLGSTTTAFLLIAAEVRTREAQAAESRGDVLGGRASRAFAAQYRALATSLTPFATVNCSRV